MDEYRQGVATNGARAESTSEQGWGKDRRRQRPRRRRCGVNDPINQARAALAEAVEKKP